MHTRLALEAHSARDGILSFTEIQSHIKREDNFTAPLKHLLITTR